MKKSVYTIGSLLILLIAALVFVLVPIFSGGRISAGIPAFGKYDGIEIKYEQGSDFYNAVANYADYFKSQNGEVTPQIQNTIFRYAFDAAVTQTAYKKIVKDSGWITPVSAVNRAMKPYFTDEKGVYSDKIYKQADPQRVAELRKSFENTLEAARYQEDMFGSSSVIGKTTLFGVKYNKSEAEFIQKMNTASRSFYMAVFNMNDYPDSEKAAYGNKNAEKFIRYDFSVITCADKSKATALSKRLANNEITFEDAISEYSQKSYSNDMGKLTNQNGWHLEKIIVNKDDVQSVAALKSGETSNPVQTTIGFSIFKADSDSAAPDFSKADFINAVSSYINLNQAGLVEDYFKSQAQKFTEEANTNGFNAACRKFKIEKKEISYFPLNYGNTSVMDKLDTSIAGLAGASTNENFLKTAFSPSLKASNISEPLVIGRNIIVLQLIGEGKNKTDSIPAEAIQDEFKNLDLNSANNTLHESSKFIDNFNAVYSTYMQTK